MTAPVPACVGLCGYTHSGIVTLLSDELTSMRVGATPFSTQSRSALKSSSRPLTGCGNGTLVALSGASQHKPDRGAQSLKGIPGVEACGSPGATRWPQSLAVGWFANALRTKRNSSSKAALTPPLCVMPG